MFSGLPFRYIFILVVGFGSLFSLSSRHWLGVWAGLEINLIGFLPILVYQKRALERESAVKYFVIQALGSRLLMFGSLFSYGLSLSWESLTRALISAPSGALLLSFGLLLKIGIFPFHFWFPRVIAGLSWFSCLLLATWQKLAPVFLVVALMEAKSLSFLALLVCLLGAGSRLAGGFGGLNQTQVRALLAYSSIGHIGWILFGLSSSERTIKIYFMIYVAISICVFLSLWASDSGNLKNLRALRNSNWGGPFTFILILLSLGGLPPLLGFISKWIVITAGSSTSSWGLLFLLVLGSLISLFYYLRLFFSEVLSLKGETISFKGLTELKGRSYINLIVLINILGGLFLLLALPERFF